VKEEERRLAAEQKKCVEAELRAANAKLRAQPFAVGDRVRGQGKFYGLGNGTIVARKDYGEIVTFEVVLDSATRLGLSPSHMARLIPGDAGFELNDAKRTEIAQKLVEKDATDELRAQPLVVGDRIRHRTGGGLGTVVGDDVPGQPNCCSLRSDKGRVLTVHRDYLEKLLPGDAGFVPLAVVEVATGAAG
jgi:hypothetical protein